LADSRARLERVLNEIDAGKSAVGMFASPSAQLLGGESGWPALLEQSQAVLDGRDAAINAQKAAAVVRDADEALPAAANFDFDFARARVNRVLDQLFHDGCRTLNHFTRRDFCREIVREDVNRHY
jgi:hypothetical protein